MDWELISEQVLRHVEECLPGDSSESVALDSCVSSRSNPGEPRGVERSADHSPSGTSEAWLLDKAPRSAPSCQQSAQGTSNGSSSAMRDNWRCSSPTHVQNPLRSYGLDSRGLERLRIVFDGLQQQQAFVDHVMRIQRHDVGRGLTEMRAVLRRMELLEARMSEQDSHLGSLGVVSSKTGGMMASLSVRQDQLDAKGSDIHDALAMLERRCLSAETLLHGAATHGQVIEAIRSVLGPFRDQVMERLSRLEAETFGIKDSLPQASDSGISADLAAAMEKALMSESEQSQGRTNQELLEETIERRERQHDAAMVALKLQVESLMLEVKGSEAKRHSSEVQIKALSSAIDSVEQRLRPAKARETAQIRREVEETEIHLQRRIEEVRASDIRRMEEVLGELKREKEARQAEYKKSAKEMSDLRAWVLETDSKDRGLHGRLGQIEASVGSTMEIQSQVGNYVTSMGAQLKKLQLKETQGTTVSIVDQLAAENHPESVFFTASVPRPSIPPVLGSPQEPGPPASMFMSGQTSPGALFKDGGECPTFRLPIPKAPIDVASGNMGSCLLHVTASAAHSKDHPPSRQGTIGTPEAALESKQQADAETIAARAKPERSDDSYGGKNKLINLPHRTSCQTENLVLSGSSEDKSGRHTVVTNPAHDKGGLTLGYLKSSENRLQTTETSSALVANEHYTEHRASSAPLTASVTSARKTSTGLALNPRFIESKQGNQALCPSQAPSVGRFGLPTSSSYSSSCSGSSGNAGGTSSLAGLAVSTRTGTLDRPEAELNGSPPSQTFPSRHAEDTAKRRSESKLSNDEAKVEVVPSGQLEKREVTAVAEKAKSLSMIKKTGMAPAVPFALEKAFSGNSSSSSSVHRSDSSTSGDEDDITAGRVVQKKRAPPAIPPPPPTPVPEKPTLVRRSTSGGGTALPAPVIFREKSGSKDAGVVTVQCEFCLRRYLRTAMTTHLQTCELRLVRCPFQCGIKVLVRNLEKHRASCSRRDSMGSCGGGDSPGLSKPPNSVSPNVEGKSSVSAKRAGHDSPNGEGKHSSSAGGTGRSDAKETPIIDPSDTSRNVTCMRCHESLPFHLVPSHGPKCKGGTSGKDTVKGKTTAVSSGSTLRSGSPLPSPNPVVGDPSTFNPPLPMRTRIGVLGGQRDPFLAPATAQGHFIGKIPPSLPLSGNVNLTPGFLTRSPGPLSTVPGSPKAWHATSRPGGVLPPGVNISRSPPRPKDMRFWSTRQVTSWLREVMRPPRADVISKFHEGNIDGAALLELTDRDLLHPTTGMGITDAETRRQILDAVDALLC